MTKRLTYRVYWEIAEDVRRRIRAGEYPPGSALPSYRALARSYDVSIGTAQRAIRLLRTQGLARGVPGRGVFVTRR
jgi:GntR family transcriptional regulator